MKTFLLLCDFGEIINMLTDSEAGQIIKAVFDYEINSVMPEFSDRTLQIVFFDIKRFLDSNRENYEKICRQRSENAKKRWEKYREKADSTVELQNGAQAYMSMHKHTAVGNVNDNINVNADVNANADINVCVNADADYSKQVTQKHKKAYGEFKNVYLTDDEYNLVKNNLAEGERKLRSLSAYIKETGKSYNDHYATLINWSFYGNEKSGFTPCATSAEKRQKPPGERREPTFDVSAFTKKGLNLKYVPPQED